MDPPRGQVVKKLFLTKALFAIFSQSIVYSKYSILRVFSQSSEVVGARRAPQCPPQELEGRAHRALNF